MEAPTAAADRLGEAEVQALIAHLELAEPIETPNNIGYAFYPRDLPEAARYFRRSLVDWGEAYPRLVSRGLMQAQGDGYLLTPQGLQVAAEQRRARPPIYYWYADFYRTIPHSRAHATLCERLFGENLGQDGFMDMAQLDLLIREIELAAGDRVLDLGCGNGGIAATIAGRTGAQVCGMDYIPEAIAQAQERAARDPRLSFTVGNLDAIPYPPGAFDAIVAVDSLYMPNDLASTLGRMRDLLRPGGRMGLLYSYALWGDPAATADSLQAGRTPLGLALAACGLRFRARDLTAADYDHALRKQQVAEELRDAFADEGNLWLYEVQAGTAAGVRQAIEAGAHARYLYVVTI